MSPLHLSAVADGKALGVHCCLELSALGVHYCVSLGVEVVGLGATEAPQANARAKYNGAKEADQSSKTALS